MLHPSKHEIPPSCEHFLETILLFLKFLLKTFVGNVLKYTYTFKNMRKGKKKNETLNQYIKTKKQIS